MILAGIFFPVLLFGQGGKKQAFAGLVEELNRYLAGYETLSPARSDSYHSLGSFGLGRQESRALVKEAASRQALSAGRDSVLSDFMIGYLQPKIVNRLTELTRHPDFLKHDIRKLISSEELSVVVSDDNKLFSFSFDEKTGGSYRSRISLVHYTGFIPGDSAESAAFQSFFDPDGCGSIYTLHTEEGTKYMLTGYVRGCSYCFRTFVRLIAFSDNQFREEFSYSVTNRDWNDGVQYDHETRTVKVDYHLDDLTPYCSCSGEADEDTIRDNSEGEVQYRINCRCMFVFNGKSFELVEGSWKRVEQVKSKK